jgi:hypothetical protein
MTKSTRDTNDVLVTVGFYRDEAQAHIAKTKLESEGIEACVYGEVASGIAGSTTSYGVLLKTRETDANQATKILGEA